MTHKIKRHKILTKHFSFQTSHPFTVDKQTDRNLALHIQTTKVPNQLSPAISYGLGKNHLPWKSSSLFFIPIDLKKQRLYATTFQALLWSLGSDSFLGNNFDVSVILESWQQSKNESTLNWSDSGFYAILSPKLTKFYSNEFLFVVYFKSKIFLKQHSNLKDLKSYLKSVSDEIDGNVLHPAVYEFNERLKACIKPKGNNFEI